MKRKVVSHQSYNVCDMWGRSQCIFLGATAGTFYPEPEPESPTILLLCILVQDLYRTGMNARAIAIGHPIQMVDLIKLMNKEY